MRLISLFTILFCLNAMASGDSHHASGPSVDLLYKAFNFSVLFGFIIWKIKRPLSEMFTSSAQEIEKYCQYAEKMNKEAQTKLDTYEKKLSSAESERNKILQEAQENSSKFALQHETETKNQIEKYFS